MCARSPLLVPCIALLCGASIAAGLLALRHPRMQSTPLPTMPTILSMYFKAGNVDSSVTCTATAGSAYTYGVLTYSVTQTIPAALSSTLTMSGMTAPGSYSWALLNVNCRLPAKATLARMVPNELGPV